jgi:hypothetical protein
VQQYRPQAAIKRMVALCVHQIAMAIHRNREGGLRMQLAAWDGEIGGIRWQ